MMGYTRRVLPFVDEEYFKDRNERAVYGLIRDHVHATTRLRTRMHLAWRWRIVVVCRSKHTKIVRRL